MDKYEYKVIYNDLLFKLNSEKVSVDIERILNEHGSQGWELCSINRGLLYFKRKVS